MSTKDHVIQKRQNRSGRMFALVGNADGTYTVWARRENYARHSPSGIATSWGYVAPSRSRPLESRYDYATAKDLFDRRTK